jgi:hypothetical protein
MRCDEQILGADGLAGSLETSSYQIPVVQNPDRSRLGPSTQIGPKSAFFTDDYLASLKKLG